MGIAHRAATRSALDGSRLQGLAAKRALHQFRRAHRGGEAAPLVPVGGQRGVDRMRRDLIAEFRPGGAVACRAPSRLPVSTCLAIAARATG